MRNIKPKILFRWNQDSSGSYSFTEHWLDGNTQYDVFGYYDALTNETKYESTVNKTVAVYNPSDVTATVNGTIEVENKNANTMGVYVYPEANLTEAKLEATVNGDISAESGKMARGISINNYGGDDDIDVYGDVTVTGTNNAAGIYSYADNEGKTDIFIAEDLNVKSDAYACGMQVDTYSGAGFSAEIGESMTVKGDMNAFGIRIGGTESDTSVSVGDDLNVSGGNYAYGVYSTAYHDATVTVDIDGSVDVSSDKQAQGLYAQTRSGGTVDITVGEGIEVTGKTLATGIQGYAGGENSKTEIEVKSGGVFVDADSATAVTAAAYDGGETIIDITGDVISSGDGLYLSALENSEASVLIDGTLSGENASIVLSSPAVNGNMNLTVWEVKANEDGNLAERYDVNEDQGGRVADKEFEKQIQYIIKMEPNENATLSTEGTTKYEGYNVAHEGDKVVLKVNVADGYHIVNAFNGTDTRVELLRDENGNYYLVIPRGGAVLLSVTLEADAPAAPAPVVEEEEAPAAPVYTYVPPVPSMPKVEDSPETAALKGKIEAAIKAAAGDIFSFLPDAIKALIPEEFKKIGQILTLELINYTDNMGEVSFLVETEKKYEEGEVAFVVFVIPGDNETYLAARAEGMADGTLKISPDVETLKQLANKKFVAVILDMEEAAE